MREINLKNIEKIHFVGIGGISMLGLSKLMLSYNKIITGSDETNSKELENLRAQGVKIFLKHNKKNIKKDIDLVVYTGAIKEDNIELMTAKNMGIRVMERSEFLGLVAGDYREVIAITGTHGKTTTTALIGKIFECAGLNPTLHIGGEVLDFDSNFVIGKKDYFITEACEYRESFKYLKPTTAVITNIEPDHLDYYKTFENLKSAFQCFAKSTKNDLILCDNKHLENININANITTIGVGCLNEITATNIIRTDSGYNFDVLKKDEIIGNFYINMFGFHNVLNSLCAIVVGLKYDIDVSIIKKALAEFKGIKRRYEKIGDVNDVAVICDYAHHPTEIINSIAGIREKYEKILCVFQPHTYTRTHNLMEEFRSCFKGVDSLAIFKTYPARERYLKSGSARTLYNNFDRFNFNKFYLSKNSQLKKFLDKNSRNFDVILVLGAGDIYNRVKKVIFRKKIC